MMTRRATSIANESSEMDALRGIEIARAVDGKTVIAGGEAIPGEGRVAALFLTQFGDFDSWELAQRATDDVGRLREANVRVVAIGIGSVDAAKEFAKRTNFPLENLYADVDAKCHAALGFAPGMGRKGGEFEWIEDKMPFVNGYAKLLLMCAGIGSPGTLPAVFGGYFGSKYKDEIFREGSNVDVPTIRKAMKLTLGDGYLLSLIHI